MGKRLDPRTRARRLLVVVTALPALLLPLLTGSAQASTTLDEGVSANPACDDPQLWDALMAEIADVYGQDSPYLDQARGVFCEGQPVKPVSVVAKMDTTPVPVPLPGGGVCTITWRTTADYDQGGFMGTGIGTLLITSRAESSSSAVLGTNCPSSVSYVIKASITDFGFVGFGQRQGAYNQVGRLYAPSTGTARAHYTTDTLAGGSLPWAVPPNPGNGSRLAAGQRLVVFGTAAGTTEICTDYTTVTPMPFTARGNSAC